MSIPPHFGTKNSKEPHSQNGTEAERLSSESVQPLWSALSSRESLLLAIALVVITTVLTFAKVAGFDFVTWDDSIHVYDNPYFQNYKISEIRHFWRHPYQELYIPLSYTVFALLTLAAHRPAGSLSLTNTGAPLDPHIFHIANLSLHALNVVLVLLLLRRLTRQDLAAVFGAMVFAVHPLQVESVAWISELRGLLGASFTLASIHLFMDYASPQSEGTGERSRVLYAASLFLGVCAMLSKPSCVIIGLLLALISVWSCKQSWKSAIALTAPFFAVGAILVVVTSRVQPISGEEAVALWLRPFIAADALSFYICKFAAPFRMAIDYGRKPRWVLSQWWVFADWILPVALGVIAVSLRKKASYFAFGLGLMAISLLPVLGLTPFEFQEKSTVADRYMYLPILGAAVIIAFAFAAVPKAKRMLAGAGFSIWLIFLAVLASKQSTVWRNSEWLYTNAIAVNPRSGVSQNGLGNELEDRKDYSDAAKHYLIAVEDDPSSTFYRLNLGQEYLLLGETTQAESQFRSLVAIAPTDSEAHRDLGIVLLQENRESDGIPELLTAFHLEPLDSKTSIWLGACYMDQHNYQSAVAAFSNGLRYCPYSGALWRGLGAALFDTGHREQAIRALKRAVQLDPTDQAARTLLVTIQK